jgi:hypothetical protein
MPREVHVVPDNVTPETMLTVALSNYFANQYRRVFRLGRRATLQDLADLIERHGWDDRHGLVVRGIGKKGVQITAEAMRKAGIPIDGTWRTGEEIYISREKARREQELEERALRLGKGILAVIEVMQELGLGT